VHHAWVIDEDDRAIDVTWTKRAESPRIYRGAVEADYDTLREHIIARGINFDPMMCCMSDWCYCINLLGEGDD
jgi:hypothetical protein